MNVTTDVAGRVLEPQAWPSDRFDENTYWQWAGTSFADAMNEEVEAALRLNAAEITATIERVEARDPFDDRPLLLWFDGWHTRVEGAEQAACMIRAAGGRARIHSVAGVLSLAV